MAYNLLDNGTYKGGGTTLPDNGTSSLPLTAVQLNQISKQSGYTGGNFSSVGLTTPTTLHAQNTAPTSAINLTPPVDNTNYAALVNGATQIPPPIINPNDASVKTDTPSTQTQSSNNSDIKIAAYFLSLKLLQSLYFQDVRINCYVMIKYILKYSLNSD